VAKKRVAEFNYIYLS